MLNSPERWRITMSDPFDSPRLPDLKLVETQEAENSHKDNKDKKESSHKEPTSPPSPTIQSNSQPTPQKKAPHLRLVASNPSPSLTAPKKKLSETLSPDTGFTYKIEEHGRGCYMFTACDPFHHIDDIELLLTIKDIDEENIVFDEDGFVPEELEPSLVCHFPDIVSGELYEFVYEDETLYEAIVSNFQLKVLRELLLFCSEETVVNLTILADEIPSPERAFRIYESLARFKDIIPTKTGTQTRLTICSTPSIYDRLVDIIDINAGDFRQTVWKEQRNNFAMRAYLKSNPTLQYID